MSISRSYALAILRRSRGAILRDRLPGAIDRARLRRAEQCLQAQPVRATPELAECVGIIPQS
jgi:DNA-binding transcriptional regulator YdaS (Cro superfamily)